MINEPIKELHKAINILMNTTASKDYYKMVEGHQDFDRELVGLVCNLINKVEELEKITTTTDLVNVTPEVIDSILDTCDFTKGEYTIPEEYQFKKLWFYEPKSDMYIVFYGDTNFFGESFNTFQEVLEW